jgi:hypothetical protein
MYNYSALIIDTEIMLCKKLTELKYKSYNTNTRGCCNIKLRDQHSHSYNTSKIVVLYSKNDTEFK